MPLRRVCAWDTRSREFTGDAENEAIVEEFMNRVHPDDAERVWAAYHAALDPAEPHRTATEFRVRRGDGEVRWVETFGQAYFEGDGRERRAVRVVGTGADGTEGQERDE